MTATAKEFITPAAAMRPQSDPNDGSDMNYLPAIAIKNSSEAYGKDRNGLPEAEQASNMAVHSSESASEIVEEAPRAWTWAFNKLTKLVSETKGAATAEVVKFVMKHLAGTKLIFVVGKTGTGKTTILKELTGLEGLNPGETVDAGTKEYSVCPAIIDDEQYLFIDTAGFGDPKRNDLDIFRDTVTCLMAFGPFVQVVGVLFIIGRPGTRLEQNDVKTLRWVQCFCGPAFLRNVTFVTSFWDSYSKGAFNQAYNRMKSLVEDEIVKQALEPSDSKRRYHGVHIYHHGVTGGVLAPDAFPGLDLNENVEERKEELRNLIRRRYSELRFKPAKLQFMNEVEDRTPFLLTEAAKVLRAPVDSTAVKFLDGKCVLRKAIESHDAPPPHFEQAPDQEPTGWAHGIRNWFELARRVSSFFQEVRRKESTSFGSGIQHAWNHIRAWWSGESDEA